MAVRFSTDARRIVVAATSVAEARGLQRPRVRELRDVLVGAGIPVVELSGPLLDADLEPVLAAAGTLAGAAELGIGELAGALARAERVPTVPDRPERATPSLGTARTPPVVVRVGVGYDSHRFASGGPMVLGGVRIECDVHCAGHSDGDAACHALTDAILGAMGAGDIGEMFPDSDPANAGSDSIGMLAAAVRRVAMLGARVVNADITIIAERPRVGPHRDAMRTAIAAALGVAPSAVSIKGKSNEQMGWIGRGEGLAAIAVASVGVASR
jgi:2-C-methyl-D-erythritol 2,4-cyclodiphosphate synthase